MKNFFRVGSPPPKDVVVNADGEYVTTLLDLYQAAFLCFRGFKMQLTMAGNRVAFAFAGGKEEIDKALDDYFTNADLQQFVGQIRNLKIALHERLRREGL